ncbi:DUF3667 domain-containing protein [Chitinophaga alhagiae]|uniref:DUF3667 domain-containing protein n=1 Tax=Chitinophaga alhagiae TaxID=2203219 RepID=UPI0013004F8B|nr:DUF3667 domain-containing protein [Chitinophaga alhagiae]
MKTQHLRKDKTCLNCGAEVPERFCSRCGQENVETKESFGHLVSHFFQDITHYDSKLLLTLKNLFFYPGLLTKKYVQGHRADYVNPIRLYVFTSFLFFLLLGSVNHGENPYLRKKPHEKSAAAQENEKAVVTFSSVEKRLKDSLATAKPEDSADYKIAANAMESFARLQNDTTGRAAIMYDSLQQLKPEHERDGFFIRNLQRRHFEMRDKYGDNESTVLRENMMHHYPKLMFLLLPFFALLLKIVFRRKDLYYADHAIFAIHIHTFVFMIYMAGIVLNLLVHNDDVYAWLMLPLFLYFVMAARNMYERSWIGALCRSLLVVFLYAAGTLIVALLFIILMFAIT